MSHSESISPNWAIFADILNLRYNLDKCFSYVWQVMPLKLNDKWDFYHVHVLPYWVLDIGTNLVKNEIPTNGWKQQLSNSREIIWNTHQYLCLCVCVCAFAEDTLEFTCTKKVKNSNSFIVCRRIHVQKNISRTKGENDYGQKGERMRSMSVLQAYVEHKYPDGTRSERAFDEKKNQSFFSVYWCSGIVLFILIFLSFFFLNFKKRVYSCLCPTHLAEVQMYSPK